MALVVKAPPTFGFLMEIEDEEDLFEIDLEAVENIPPPRYYWGSYITNNTGAALFANCLVPAADVSSAIPAAAAVTQTLNTATQKTMPRRKEYLFSVPPPVPLGKLLQLPYSRALASYSGK